MKKVIVFGGSGFLGSAVVRSLLNSNYKISVFDKQQPILNSEIEFIEGNILDKEAVKKALHGHSIVFNFAGAANLEGSIQDPLRYLNLNVIGNANILQSAVEYGGVERFVYASSAYALSDKGAFYGISKNASEKILKMYHKSFGLKYTILRYGSVYGPGADRTNRIFRFISEAVESKSITFPGLGSEEREYIHVDDAAELSVKILDAFGENSIFILTGIERHSYMEVINLIDEIMGSNLDLKCSNEEYQGHYKITPYQYDPDLGKKIVNNPSIDFGQGLLQCIQEVSSLNAEK